MINKTIYTISSEEINNHQLPENFNSLSKEEKLDIINNKMQNSKSDLEREFYRVLKFKVSGIMSPGHGF